MNWKTIAITLAVFALGYQPAPTTFLVGQLVGIFIVVWALQNLVGMVQTKTRGSNATPE